MIEANLIHDATLEAFHVSWAAGSCTVCLSTVNDGHVQLVFKNIASVLIPRAQPWGPSVSVNVIREAMPGLFELELQSGDVVRIEARSCSFVSVEHESSNPSFQRTASGDR